MSNKSSIPPPVSARCRAGRKPRVHTMVVCALAACLTLVASNAYLNSSTNAPARAQIVPLNAEALLVHCAMLKMVPGPPAGFLDREASDRYEEGTRSTLIRNATIWTGGKNSTEIVYGDVLLDRGIVKAVGYVPKTLLQDLKEVDVVNADGAWVTPGLIDFHSHIGIYSLPALVGSFNLNSHNGPILPYLRTIDTFDTHDDSILAGIAGGITAIQILPGSANAIAGQAFMLKLRTTSEHSQTSMVIEPPYSMNGTVVDPSAPPRWRYLKQAAGENIDAYGTRMDSMWAYRQAYSEARKVKSAQDAYCADVEAGLWNRVAGDFPEDLRLEVLVDVLRGRVKVSQHVYEAVDMDSIVRLSNEFRFRIDSFHHAAEAYIVPKVLNKTWGGAPPAIALFADNYRYKRESYRGSVHAPRVLADSGFPVIMKTDHPAINGRFLLYEAQQAHYYGLPAPLALASVTSTPATVAGLDHRIGFLRKGVDADVVLWDSHPLRLGATPKHVWIDGSPQAVGAQSGVVVGKGKDAPEWNELPEVPDWRKERKKTVEWEGLPPLKVESVRGMVVFANVSQVMGRSGSVIERLFSANAAGEGVVVVENGRVACAGTTDTCSSFVDGHARTVDMQGGSLAPALISFGSMLGLEEIAYEFSTGDGPLYDAFIEDIPSIVGDVGGVVQAADALQFQTRNALLAHRYGVTVGTSYSHTLFSGTVIAGLSTTFRTGAPHALADGAVIQRVSALHYSARHPAAFDPRAGRGVSAPSVSTRIAVLRRLLLGAEPKGETGVWFARAAEGSIPLVLDVGSADVMARLLELKREVEEKRGTRMRMVFAGAAEAHLLAKEIGAARVGVILTPVRPMPLAWEDRRLLPGPPLSNETAVTTLLANNVLLGIGTPEAAFSHQTRFDLAWIAADAGGRMSQEQTLELASVNLERLLGIDRALDGAGEMVAYAGGGPLDLKSKVVGVLSGGRGVVDLI